MKQYEYFARLSGLYGQNDFDLYDVFVDQIVPHYNITELNGNLSETEFVQSLFNDGLEKDNKLIAILHHYKRAFLDYVLDDESI